MNSLMRIYHKTDKVLRDVHTIDFRKGYVIADMGYADNDRTTRWDALIPEEEYELSFYIGIRDSRGEPIYTGDIIEAAVDLSEADMGKVTERMVVSTDISALADIEDYRILGAEFYVVGNIFDGILE